MTKLAAKFWKAVGFVLALGFLFSISNAVLKHFRGWRTFASPVGDFTISTPGWLHETSEDVPSSLGTMHRYRCYVSQSDKSFEVERWDYPSGSVSRQPLEETLDGARNGGVAAIRGLLLSEKPITLGADIGRELEIETKDGRLISFSRMYVRGDHLYAVIVVVRRGEQNDPAIKRFLDSFSLTTAVK